MNNFKKIGLSALAGSLVATSAFAGEMSVAGGASLNVEHTNGGGGDSGKTFSMGNQLTFSGGGELDNGLNVALSFVIDQGDDTAIASGPFDSHSVTISSDGLGSLKFSGEGGSSALTAMDGTAAGDIWDSFDIASTVHPTGLGGGNNSMMYTLPAIMDGVAINASYTPRGASADSSTAWNVTYTGVEGLSASYAMGDGSNESTDGTAFKVSYAMGPITVGFQANESDAGTGTDEDFTAYGISYAVSDDVSVSYGASSLDYSSALEDQESSAVSVSFTAGGVAMSASHQTTDNVAGATATDNSSYEINFSFAF